MPLSESPVKPVEDVAAVSACRVSGSPLTPLFDFGQMYVSDFVPDPKTEGVKAPLCVAVGEDAPFVPQLTHSFPPDALYRRYHYRSGTNEAMQRELWDVVRSAEQMRPLSMYDTVLDIASNDGCLLECYRYSHIPFLKRIGIDPSDVARQAADAPSPGGEGYAKGGVLINDFFSADAYHTATDDKAAIITCVAMFYDLDDPAAFLRDVRAVIREDGLFVLQLHYAPMLLKTNAWDSICHEHLCYYDLRALKSLLMGAGFDVVDATLSDSNGGSIRLFCLPSGGWKLDAVRAALGQMRLTGLREAEWLVVRDGRAGVVEAWTALHTRALKAKWEVLRFLTEAKERGKKVVGYGASTKGNTLLQFFDIGPDLLPCIADRQAHKHGRYTVGTGIPIVSEAEMRAMKPDYLFALPWHLVDSFVERERALLEGGTRFVVPLPCLRVVGGEA